MTRAEACIAKATECERASFSASDARARNIYWELGKQWRELAAEAESLEQGQRLPNR